MKINANYHVHIYIHMYSKKEDKAQSKFNILYKLNIIEYMIEEMLPLWPKFNVCYLLHIKYCVYLLVESLVKAPPKIHYKLTEHNI